MLEAESVPWTSNPALYALVEWYSETRLPQAPLFVSPGQDSCTDMRKWYKCLDSAIESRCPAYDIAQEALITRLSMLKESIERHYALCKSASLWITVQGMSDKVTWYASAALTLSPLPVGSKSTWVMDMSKAYKVIDKRILDGPSTSDKNTELSNALDSLKAALTAYFATRHCQERPNTLSPSRWRGESGLKGVKVPSRVENAPERTETRARGRPVKAVSA